MRDEGGGGSSTGASFLIKTCILSTCTDLAYALAINQKKKKTKKPTTVVEREYEGAGQRRPALAKGNSGIAKARGQSTKNLSGAEKNGEEEIEGRRRGHEAVSLTPPREELKTKEKRNRSQGLREEVLLYKSWLTIK